MKTKSLQYACATACLAVSLSGCRTVEPVQPSLLKKVSHVFVKEENDIYSAYALLENEPIIRDELGLVRGFPLFDKASNRISYVLNGKHTRNREAAKKVFTDQVVKEVYVQDEQATGQKTVVIEYEKKIAYKWMNSR